MKSRTVFAAAVFALTACAGGPQEESVIAENDAIDDYIEVADLTAVDHIRYQRELHHKQISENYILVYEGRDKQPHLLAFVRRCRELNEIDVTPDRRYEAHKLHAKFDTYRGCRIRNLYEITPGQATELLALGEKPMQ